MRWRTANNRRAKRSHSNALIATLFRADGSVAKHTVSPLPNALERAKFHLFLMMAS